MSQAVKSLLPIRDRLVRQTTGLSALALIVVLVGTALVSMAWTASGDFSLPPLGYLGGIVGFTAKQALLSAGLSVMLGLPLAMAMARQPVFPGRRLIIQMMSLPMGLPVIVGAFALLAIWGRRGLLNTILGQLGIIDAPISIYGLSGILLAHVFFNLPLAARLFLQALDRVPRQQWTLAASLGMGRVSTFRFIEWPALARVLPGIFVLIVMLCATSFTIVLTLGGGPAATTLEVAIYQSLKLDYDPARAVILAGLQIAVAVISYRLVNSLISKDNAHTISGGLPKRLDGEALRARLSDGVAISLFTLFLVGPLIQIVVAGLGPQFLALFSAHSFLIALSTSLALSFGSGLAATILSLALIEGRFALSQTLGSRWMAAILSEAPIFVLLVPTLALATGWFLILNQFGWVEPAAPLVVMAINTLMALPFTLRVLEPALDAHHEGHDLLAASLGLTGLARIRILDWPVLKAPVLAAFGFGMALSLGDLGAIAIFGSDHLMTLPSLLYARLGSYRADDAASIALVLAMLALAMAWPAARLEALDRTTTARQS